MMNEERIRNAIRSVASDKLPSEHSREAIYNALFPEDPHRITSPATEGGKTMRNKGKMIILIAAACCALTATIAIAAGKTAISESHSALLNASSKYSDLPKYEKKAGFKVLHSEDLGSGYTFESVNYNENQDYDADGAEIASYKGLDISYLNNDGARVVLSAYRDTNSSYDPALAQETKEYKGTAIYYSMDTYLFLPPNEAPTAEEQEREASDPHYYISYGSEQRETKQSSNCAFTKDGIDYYLMSLDKPLSAKEMFGFAETLLSQ